MFTLLHDYDDSRRISVEDGGGVSTVPKRIRGRPRKPSRGTLKHHIFTMNIPSILFEAIWGNCDVRQDEYRKSGIFRRVAKIPISTAPN